MADPIDPCHVAEAADALRQGRVVALATDTVYALAADPENAVALALLRKMKGSNPSRALAVLIAEMQIVSDVAGALPWHARAITNAFWPGPLTIIVPVVNEGRLRHMCSERRTVALRLPNHDAAVSLLRCFGGPIAATSANVSGQAPLHSLVEIEEEFGDSRGSLYVLSGGAPPDGSASTVVDLAVMWDMRPDAYLRRFRASLTMTFPPTPRIGTIDRRMLADTFASAARLEKQTKPGR